MLGREGKIRYRSRSTNLDYIKWLRHVHQLSGTTGPGQKQTHIASSHDDKCQLRKKPSSTVKIATFELFLMLPWPLLPVPGLSVAFDTFLLNSPHDFHKQRLLAPPCSHLAPNRNCPPCVDCSEAHTTSWDYSFDPYKPPKLLAST